MPTDQGVVTFVNPERGFGFITCDGTIASGLFFRLEDARFAVERGMRVRFTTTIDKLGRLHAIDVRRAA
jgi:cold shock CspA family protein